MRQNYFVKVCKTCLLALKLLCVCTRLEMKGKLGQSLSLRYGRGPFWKQPNITCIHIEVHLHGDQNPLKTYLPSETGVEETSQVGRLERIAIQFVVLSALRGYTTYVSDHSHMKPNDVISKWTLITVKNTVLILLSYSLIFTPNLCSFFPRKMFASLSHLYINTDRVISQNILSNFEVSAVRYRWLFIYLKVSVIVRWMGVFRLSLLNAEVI